jgi:hypothetical protein
MAKKGGRFLATKRLTRGSVTTKLSASSGKGAVPTTTSSATLCLITASRSFGL